MTHAQSSTHAAQQQRLLGPRLEKDERCTADIRIKSSVMKRESALGSSIF